MVATVRQQVICHTMFPYIYIYIYIYVFVCVCGWGGGGVGGGGGVEVWNSGVAGGIAARGQIYMGAPIGVVEIHLQFEITALTPPPPFAPPLGRGV